MYLGPIVCEYCGVVQTKHWKPHFTWCLLVRGHSPSPNDGWVCYRCDKVNAPHVKQCDCGPQKAISTGWVFHRGSTDDIAELGDIREAAP